MKLFVARWPDGTAWLIKASSMEEVADILDEAGDPGACEVRPYTGPLVLEFQPSEERSLEFRVTEAAASYDMQKELAEVAYPVLDKMLEHDEEPIPEEWMAAVENERRRELHPSSKWADSVRVWWETMSGGDADRTAALRDMVDVTIPGEPKPETPEQRRLFEEAQRRMAEGVWKMLSEPASPPPPDPAKKGG